MFNVSCRFRIIKAGSTQGDYIQCQNWHMQIDYQAESLALFGNYIEYLIQYKFVISVLIHWVCFQSPQTMHALFQKSFIAILRIIFSCHVFYILQGHHLPLFYFHTNEAIAGFGTDKWLYCITVMCQKVQISRCLVMLSTNRFMLFYICFRFTSDIIAATGNQTDIDIIRGRHDSSQVSSRNNRIIRCSTHHM